MKLIYFQSKSKYWFIQLSVGIQYFFFLFFALLSSYGAISYLNFIFDLNLRFFDFGNEDLSDLWFLIPLALLFIVLFSKHALSYPRDLLAHPITIEGMVSKKYHFKGYQSYRYWVYLQNQSFDVGLESYEKISIGMKLRITFKPVSRLVIKIEEIK